jgi:hypothetical protein
MPRSEARIFTSIWDDPDFLALPPGAQRLYMFLLSQRELTYCGTMPLRPMRWAKKAAGLALADVERDLKELEGNGNPSRNPPSGTASRQPFVITDPEAGELLVRSLIRRDTAWKQPNLLKLAIESATEVESVAIRSALLAEVHRLPVDESPSAQVRTLIAEFIQDLEKGLLHPYGYPPDDPSGNPERDPNENSDGEGLDNGRARARFLQAPISGLQTPLPSPPAPDRRLGARLPDDWLPTRELVEWARRECPHVDSRRETEQFRDYWHAKPGKDGRKLDWVKTWRRWMRTAEDRQGPRDRPGRQQETDDIFDAAAQRIQARKEISR